METQFCAESGVPVERCVGCLSERPTADTDPGACRWCWEESFIGRECPYHGESAQREEA